MAFFRPNMEDSEDFIKPAEYRLYVNNLPMELTEEGIKEIFDHYGKIIGLFYRPNTTWAFVTYKTYREAEYAVRDLHNKPPLYLKVSFGKEKTSNIRKDERLHDEKSTESYKHLVPDSPYNSKAHLGQMNRGKSMSGFYKERGSLLPIDRYPSNDLYPVHTDPYMYNPYESLEPRNALWTRGTVTITHDGKRHVSYGRGYTNYEIPNPHPKIETLINQIHEKRLNGLYEHGEDNLKHRIGKCTHCGKAANMECERCYSFYCSRECQVVDWPSHKNECHKIPALIKNTRSSSTSSNEENISRLNLLKTQEKLRRPKQAASDALRTYTEIIKKNTNIENTDSSREENLQNDHQSNSTTNDVSKLIASKKDNTEEKGKISISDALQIEEELLFQKKLFSSPDDFIMVRIVWIVQKGIYWVQKCFLKQKLKKMQQELLTLISKQLKVEPVIGKLYAHRIDRAWRRVRVISLNPTQIFHIDFGTTTTATNNVFYNIDLEHPPFAVKIGLIPSAQQLLGTLELNNVIEVKVVQFTKDMVIVDVKRNETILIKQSQSISESDSTTQNSQEPSTKENDNEQKSEPKSAFTTLPSVLDHITKKLWGILNVHTELNDNVYGVALNLSTMFNEMDKITDELNKYCVHAERMHRESISIGQLVCGRKINGCWGRGYVISLQPIQIALIDEVRVITAHEYVAYPAKFLNICKFGVICKVINSDYVLKTDDKYQFNVISYTNEIKIEIEIESLNGLLIEAILAQWDPEPKQHHIKLFKLKSGSEVCVTSYLSHNKLYVHSLETEDQETIHKIIQDIAKCAQSAPHLKEPPVLGDMVLAQFIDDNFYRAIVTKVEEDEVAISYVDYGNSEKVSWKKLKEISADLKAHPSCVAKVVLKDVPNDIAITKDLADYFVQLTGKEIPLLCHFDGIPSKDGVSLTMANGESVNDKVKQLLIPNWKKDNEKDKTVYTVLDMTPAKFEDSETRAIVLNTVYEGIKYVMCPLDIDLITNIYDVLPGLMNEYCEKADYYIPRNNELCLGLYDGNWYRALCTDDASHTDKCQLFFLDYGNMEYVLHKDIRAMTKDFLTPASLSNICTVVNLAPKDKDGSFSPRVLKRISELVTPDENVLIKIIDTEQWGFHTIELPEVHAKLLEEGLI